MPLLRSFALLVIFASTACTASTAEKVAPVRYPRQPVEVVTDKHGIPHIYAKSDADAFWGQGYVMAELRPAQNEIFRLYSQGRRSEIFGESKLTTDMFVRAMDFPGFARKNWPAFQRGWPEVAAAFEAFAQGVNAKYAEYERDGWPRTLQVMRDAGWTPEPWDGVQVLAVAQLLGFGMAGSPDIKIEITIAKALLGPSVFEDLFMFEKPVTAVPVPDFWKRVGLAAPPALSKASAVSAGGASLESLLGAPALRKPLEDALANVRKLNQLRFGGSNGWAVAGAKMADGRAVLESDTHQGVPIPGAYVLFHLISDRGEGAEGKLDIIGSTFPGAPMVVFGHNGKAAWSPTTGFSDLTDFYWEFTDPADATRVLRPGGVSLPTTRRAERFKIRQNDGTFTYKTVELRDIPGHGPILPSEILPLPVPLKISVRWAGAELPGPAPAVYGMAFATKIEDFFDRLRDFNGGTVGFNFATTENRIAYSLWTKHPKRAGTGPFKPWFIIPGTDGPFWSGFIPFEELPHWIDPERGYLWSSNSDPVGNTFDNDPGNDPHYIGFAYALGYRGARLDKLLGALTRRGSITMPELETVQVDRYSGFAEQLIPYFASALTRGAYPLPPALKPYADAVTMWNRVAANDSYEATIFYSWAYQFIADMMIDDYQIVDEVSGDTMPIFGPALMHWLKATAPIIDGIDAGTTPFPSKSGRNYFDNRDTAKIETRDELIIEALRKAVAHLKDTFTRKANGDANVDPNNMTTWLWKRMLYLESRHTLADVEPSWEKYIEYRGSGGNVDTVNVGQFIAYRNGKLEDRYIIDNAPSNRYFWRMEKDGIKAKFMAPWGQSEDPENPHYLDLVDDYINYNYRDFPYTEAEIAAVTESRRVIAPRP